MANIIVGVVVAIILIGAIIKIYTAKKNGKFCMNCSEYGTCAFKDRCSKNKKDLV